MLKRFIAYYKPHSGMLTLDMLASLVIALVGMVYPIITEKMLDNKRGKHIKRQHPAVGFVVSNKAF